MSEEAFSDPENFPTVDQLKAAISNQISNSEISQAEYQSKFRRVSINQEREYTHLIGLQDHYKQKVLWSKILLALIVWMIFFQSVVIILVGCNLIDFSKYEWLVPALLVQNLAQVIGLAVFVVRSLFGKLQDNKLED